MSRILASQLSSEEGLGLCNHRGGQSGPTSEMVEDVKVSLPIDCRWDKKRGDPERQRLILSPPR